MLIDELKRCKRERTPKPGVCSLCRQIQYLEVPEDWDGDQVDELAKETCSCWEAGQYRQKKKQRELAEKAIQEEFGEKGANLEQSVIDTLTAISELVINDAINAGTIDVGSGAKAKIGTTKKGMIKIEYALSSKKHTGSIGGVRMVEIKKMKKMPKITGTINPVSHTENIYKTAIVVNAHASAIDYMYKIICEQNEEIKKMRKQIEKLRA